MQTDTTLLEVVVAKSLSAFKLYATTHNKMQQEVQTNACTRFKTYLMSLKLIRYRLNIFAVVYSNPFAISTVHSLLL